MSGLVRIALFASLGAAALALPGCRSLLPQGEASETRFKSFQEAAAAFEAVEPGRTTADQLRALRIDPSQPGISVLAYNAVAQVFFPHSGTPRELHDPAIGACLDAQGRCQAWYVRAERGKGKRDSNLILDVLKFHRKKKVEGYLFHGLVLVVDGVATYTIYGGVPVSRSVDQSVRPLGLLQDGPAVSVKPLDGGQVSLQFGGRSIGRLEDRNLEDLAVVGVFEEEGISPDFQQPRDATRELLSAPEP